MAVHQISAFDAARITPRLRFPDAAIIRPLEGGGFLVFDSTGDAVNYHHSGKKK